MPSMIHFWTFRDYMAEGAFDPVEPVVEGLFNRSELALISATAKTGKTWFALHLAMSVTKGMPFLGRFPTKKGRVLYIQTEVGPSSFRERISRIETVYGPISEPREEYPIISTERIKLDTPLGLENLAHSVTEIQPSLVILDSLYTLHNKDESLAKDMAPLLTEVREIAKKNNCVILIVHHQGKRSDGGTSGQAGHAARGSSAFADVPDALLSLTRKQDGQLSLSCELRSQESPDSITLRFLKESCTFELLEGGSVPDRDVGGIDKYLESLVQASGESGVLKTELVKALTTTYEKSERTIENAISRAIRSGAIEKKQEGHQVRYLVGSPQFRNSLGDCALADNAVQDAPNQSGRLPAVANGSLFDSSDSSSASRNLPTQEAP